MLSPSKNQDMVLFVAPRKIYFVAFIIARLTMFKDKKCVLLCNKGWEEVEYLKKFVEHGLFDDILFFDLHIKNSKKLKELGEDLTSEYLEKFITISYDEYFYNSKYSLNNFSYVITNSDVADYDFDIYLNIKKKNHIFLEATANKFFNRKDRLNSTAFPVPIAYKELMSKHQAYSGRSEYCTPIFHPDTTKFPVTDIYYKFFFKEELARLDEENKKKILDSYNHTFEAPSEEAQNILFLLHSVASHANAMRGNPVEAKNYVVPITKGRPVYHAVNQLAIDYLTDEGNSIFLKTHPTDPFSKKQLEEIYNGNIAITDIPGEFLSFDPIYKNFNWTSTIEFNAGHHNVSTEATKNYKVTRNFARVSFLYNRLYFVFKILEDLTFRNVFTHEAARESMGPLISKHFHEKGYKLFNSKNLIKDVAKYKKGDLFLVRDLTSSIPLDSKELQDSENVYVSFESEYSPIVEGFVTHKFEISKEEIKRKGRFLNLNSEYFYILVRKDYTIGVNKLNLEISKKLFFSGIEVKLKYLGIQEQEQEIVK